MALNIVIPPSEVILEVPFASAHPACPAAKLLL